MGIFANQTNVNILCDNLNYVYYTVYFCVTIEHNFKDLCLLIKRYISIFAVPGLRRFSYCCVIGFV